MQQRFLNWLIVIVVALAISIYVVLPTSQLVFTLGNQTFDRSQFRQGLDLQGGIQVLLEADLPAGTNINAVAMETAKRIVEQRVNGLGVAEPTIQTQGERRDRIVVELPGFTDPEQAIATIRQTGLLEFVIIPTGEFPPAEGAVIQTYCPVVTQVDCGNPAQTPAPASTEATTDTLPATTYVTLMTGAALQDATVGADEIGSPVIDFTLTGDGNRIFGAFTGAHIGDYLAIVLDKTVISAPVIQAAITDRGQISGNFTIDSANQLALQLRYGSLPVPLKVVESRVVGPSLGQDSLNRSLVAGAIGMTVVVLFMLLYYRLPGLIAVLAILTYGLITLALFKLIPVTLSLAGIAGFLLSTGSALDANILIFERLKEELRNGRSLRAALAPAWQRAWPSIRDSNIAAAIICLILYWFGSAFGASIVQGFAVTLFVGVLISLFCALIVTRTFLSATVEWFHGIEERLAWFGV